MDLVDLIASGQVERDQDKPLKITHCSVCGQKGVSKRTHAIGHVPIPAGKRTR